MRLICSLLFSSFSLSDLSESETNISLRVNRRLEWWSPTAGRDAGPRYTKVQGEITFAGMEDARFGKSQYFILFVFFVCRSLERALTAEPKPSTAHDGKDWPLPSAASIA